MRAIVADLDARVRDLLVELVPDLEPARRRCSTLRRSMKSSWAPSVFSMKSEALMMASTSS